MITSFGQIVPVSPAAAVRGPKHVVKTGKTAVLDAKEWRKLIDSIPTDTLRDRRDRALIATLTYSFARINAALKMKVEDLRPKGAGWQIQLHEKGGKQHVMPCHHALAEELRAYIDAACIAEDRKGYLFRTAPGHNATVLLENCQSAFKTDPLLEASKIDPPVERLVPVVHRGGPARCGVPIKRLTERHAGGSCGPTGASRGVGQSLPKPRGGSIA
jgi:Phage integrase family